MIEAARELWGARELVFTLVKRDLKIRYKSTALGFLWSFGRPLAIMAILWAVFSQFVGIETAHADLPYPLQLLSSLLPWMFLTGAVFEANGSILANGNIVKKIAVPSIVFPTAAVLGNLVHLFLALGVLAVFVLFSSIPFGWEVLLLPFLIAVQTLMLLGIAYLVAALNVFYRDVGSVTEIVVTMWFYLTPIIYPLQLARNKLRDDGHEVLYYLYLLNPMTPIVCAYRRLWFGSLLRHGGRELDDKTLLLAVASSTVFAVLVFLAGQAVFRRLSDRFADEL
ncbi:MAG: ABC transporter permease [Candidatus Sumerlaeia bacterium]|nr:ABC transporter permease [Candidatus Sumerlaeia bacterium]